MIGLRRIISRGGAGRSEGNGDGVDAGVDSFKSLREAEAHGDHVREVEAMFLEEALGFGADLVGEEGDAAEVFLLGVGYDVIDEARAVTLAAVFVPDDDIFHEDDETAGGGADGEEEVHHADDLMLGAHDEDTAALGFFENESETAFLCGVIGLEVLFFGKQL